MTSKRRGSDARKEQKCHKQVSDLVWLLASLFMLKASRKRLPTENLSVKNFVQDNYLITVSRSKKNLDSNAMIIEQIKREIIIAILKYWKWL